MSKIILEICFITGSQVGLKKVTTELRMIAIEIVLKVNNFCYNIEIRT